MTKNNLQFTDEELEFIESALDYYASREALTQPDFSVYTSIIEQVDSCLE